MLIILDVRKIFARSITTADARDLFAVANLVVIIVMVTRLG